MKEFPICENRKKSGHSPMLAGIMGGLALAAGLYTGSWYAVAAGVLLLGAAAFRKHTRVTEEGISIIYDARIYKYREEWPFEEIVNLHKEEGTDSRYVMLHFMRGAMSRRLLFTVENGEQVVQAALQKNPKIHVGEVDC